METFITYIINFYYLRYRIKLSRFLLENYDVFKKPEKDFMRFVPFGCFFYKLIKKP